MKGSSDLIFPKRRRKRIYVIDTFVWIKYFKAAKKIMIYLNLVLNSSTQIILETAGEKKVRHPLVEMFLAVAERSSRRLGIIRGDFLTGFAYEWIVATIFANT